MNAQSQIQQHPAPLSQLDSQLEPVAAGPTEPWLSAGLLLAGMGTVLLGPILPILSEAWTLKDSAAGVLLFAKFLGAFVGGVTVPRRLRYGVLSGLTAAFAGFSLFSQARGLLLAVPALFIAGFGLGQLIASTNILAGRRYRANTGAALARTNFFFSLGAVLVGVLIAALVPHFWLPNLLLIFAGLFIAVAVGGHLQRVSLAKLAAAGDEPIAVPLTRRTLTFFSVLLFLYGGLETCLAQWLTTYSDRYTAGDIIGGQSAVVLLFVSLTAGRAMTSFLLHKVSETRLQRVALVCSAAIIPLLANSNSGRALSICCILLGLSLAPFFPATFALLMRRRPRAREAGFILAVSGLGAAGLSWLMGVISTSAGSLRMAMAVPFAAALGLLAASFYIPALHAPEPATPPFPRDGGI